MINKNFFFFQILLRYNMMQTKRPYNFIRFNYQFYTKPIATYLTFFFFYLISLGCVNTNDKFLYNTNSYILPASLNFCDKNIFIFIF